MRVVRHSHVAGYFYPADPVTLKNDISIMMDKTRSPKHFKEIFGIVSPHAGYLYSGKTAAYAYNHLKGRKYITVIVISPSHSEYFPGVSIYNGDAYETPLGIVEVDSEVADKMVEKSKLIFRGIEGHRREHALEVQIPFLQTALNDFKIVPVVMGDQGKMFTDALAEKIAEVSDENTLVVASSDLSHFYSGLEADHLDSIVEANIQQFNYDELQKNLESHKCEACGGGPIISMMKAASLKNFNKAEVLKRSDSGDVTGDKSEVVGYLSAVIYRN